MSLFRINTNTSALFAQRQLRSGNQKLAEAQERLSSGLRINSAADDAAGLAISQKTSAQIRGLEQAATNAQDGISMIQTAEGALDESQSALQRMRELAVQSANDTLTESDREKLQSEVNALAKEIQRVSDQTEFNTKKLLDGNLTDQQLQVGANEGQTIEFSVDDMGTETSALDVAGGGETSETVENFDAVETQLQNNATLTVEKVGEGEYELQDEDGAVVGSSGDGVSYNIRSASALATSGSATITLAAKVDDGESFAVSGGTVNSGSTISPDISATNNGLEAGDYEVNGSGSTATLVDGDGNQVASFDATQQAFTDTDGNTVLDFSSEMAGSASLASTVFSGDETITVGGPDITSKESAASAITTVDDAIQEISSERSELGALQNRLESTISADNITSENLKAARSRIRDADIAQESVKQTRGNILVQAGTSVLAQANQNPQLALQLLGG